MMSVLVEWVVEVIAYYNSKDTILMLKGQQGLLKYPKSEITGKV